MKKNTNKRNFNKFTSRATHKRRGKDAAKRELERALESVGRDPSGVRIRVRSDRGRGAYNQSRHADIKEAVGVFSSTRSGFGFVTLERGADIFIPAGRTAAAIDGDKVEIEYSEYKGRQGETRTEGRIVRILEYGRTTLVGNLFEELVLFGRRRRGYVLTFIPDDPKVNLRPRVEITMGASDGDKVEVRLHRTGTAAHTCDVVRVFGSAESFSANYEAHLAECGVECDFSPGQEEEAARVASEPVSTEGRVDRRGTTVFTIDGIGAKDLDDAVSVRRLPGGLWQLGVHIADVSHYVRERTALDRAAMSRGTSVYFTDKVVPMLPVALSNGACSLGAGEDKYTLSAIINISPEGELLSVKIEPSVINSRVRGVYSEVNAIFDGKATPEIKAKYKSVMGALTRMRELYEILKKKSQSRGALELDFPEAEVLLSESGEPLAIEKRVRGVAELMIEQFMLAANESVAKFLTERAVPCVYRIHEAPPDDKLSEFLTYIHNLGFDTSFVSKTKAEPRDFARLLDKADERGLLAPVSYTMLRSMSKARYSEQRHVHFGLGIEHYCHFTSPIRRLADLATHRIIHRVLLEGKRPEHYSSYARRAAVAASEAELRATNAERKIENMYKALYMSRFIGDVFSATVNSITSFGLFCELDNTSEGLIPISVLGEDSIYEENTLTIRAGGRLYRLADTLTVRLEEADVFDGKLRFSPVFDEEGE